MTDSPEAVVPSIDDVIATATPRTRKVPICLRGDLVALHEDLQAKLLAAIRYDDEHNLPDTAPAIAEEIRELEDEVRVSTVEFVVTNIGREAWTDLVSDFPAEDEDRAMGLDFNPETFPHAAIAACVTSPTDVTAEKMKTLAALMSAGDWAALWDAVLDLNVMRSRLGESVAASVVLRASALSSAPPSSSGALDESS